MKRNYNSNFLEIYSYQHCPIGMVNSQETAQPRRTSSHHRSLETTQAILRRCRSCYAILGQFTPRIGGSCHVGVIYCVYPLLLLLFVLLFYPFLIFILRSTSARIPFLFLLFSYCSLLLFISVSSDQPSYPLFYSKTYSPRFCTSPLPILFSFFSYSSSTLLLLILFPLLLSLIPLLPSPSIPPLSTYPTSSTSNSSSLIFYPPLSSYSPPPPAFHPEFVHQPIKALVAYDQTLR